MAAAVACQVAAAVAPVQVYDDATLDAPNRPQTHCLNLPLTLPLPLPLDARSVHTLIKTCSHGVAAAAAEVPQWG